MAFAALELSADGVADFYGELLDGIVADEDVGRWRPCRRTPACTTPPAAPRVAEQTLGFAESPPASARGVAWGANRAVTIVCDQMRTAAILPVKRFAQAKQRLGASVAEPLRARARAAMVADVLAGARAKPRRSSARSSSPREDSVAAAARRQGALVLATTRPRPASRPPSTLGVRARAGGGHRAGALHPRRLPGARPARSSNRCCGRSTPCAHDEPGSEPEVVIVPDRHGTGTNGLLLTPPDAIAPSFGPGSCERHRALALAAGVAVPPRASPRRCCSTSTPARISPRCASAARGRRVRGPRARARCSAEPDRTRGRAGRSPSAAADGRARPWRPHLRPCLERPARGARRR